MQDELVRPVKDVSQTGNLAAAKHLGSPVVENRSLKVVRPSSKFGSTIEEKFQRITGLDRRICAKIVKMDTDSSDTTAETDLANPAPDDQTASREANEVFERFEKGEFEPSLWKKFLLLLGVEGKGDTYRTRKQRTRLEKMLVNETFRGCFAKGVKSCTPEEFNGLFRITGELLNGHSDELNEIRPVFVGRVKQLAQSCTPEEFNSLFRTIKEQLEDHSDELNEIRQVFVERVKQLAQSCDPKDLGSLFKTTKEQLEDSSGELNEIRQVFLERVKQLVQSCAPKDIGSLLENIRELYLCRDLYGDIGIKICQIFVPKVKEFAQSCTLEELGKLFEDTRNLRRVQYSGGNEIRRILTERVKQLAQSCETIEACDSFLSCTTGRKELSEAIPIIRDKIKTLAQSCKTQESFVALLKEVAANKKSRASAPSVWNEIYKTLVDKAKEFATTCEQKDFIEFFNAAESCFSVEDSDDFDDDDVTPPAAATENSNWEDVLKVLYGRSQEMCFEGDSDLGKKINKVCFGNKIVDCSSFEPLV